MGECQGLNCVLYLVDCTMFYPHHADPTAQYPCWAETCAILSGFTLIPGDKQLGYSWAPGPNCVLGCGGFFLARAVPELQANDTGYCWNGLVQQKTISSVSTVGANWVEAVITSKSEARESWAQYSLESVQLGIA
ncbi:BZ3500_MvSof-1268-A1-R1_Chr3-1g05718 [Microbotryum saponariae]|uniref:BZ3500_MvSof-1268-A1-R1_Chr3-1g05718 protein n=1 Tax=Microbotryum saponariae TaxID=289078 RepID=A0A2X0LIL5_9BASI|nr:BZ3500_MvSof-1268-A1-R1_Chr3-1g05718 [Microbotryum saponariae]SDA04908.1 BZ3501_MvSof-1269-A2-R1_Chr3-1g05388 [Microbotryum saponariae]